MDPFYEIYKDAGLVPIEIATNGILTLIALVGICLNLSLVYVTKKTNTLRSPCNILIALYAISASFLLSGYLIKFFVFLFGINFIPLRTCYLLIVIPTIGAGFATRLQLCIGIERLAGVSFPIWFDHRGKHLIFKFLLISCCISMPIATFIFYAAASQHWNKPVMCGYQDVTYLPETAIFTNIISLFCYVGEFLCYALMWLIIWCKKTAVSPKNKKLTLSLTILITINLFCYVLGLIVFQLVLPKLQLGMFKMEYVISPVMNGLSMMGHSSITPILLICSQDYLQAFRNCFRFINQPQTRVASLGNNNNLSSNIRA